MTETARIFDRVPLSTRSRTADGLLRGKAAFTRTGIFEYTDKELGLGNSGKIIKVYRGPDSVFHPDTISNLRGTGITDDHPDEWLSPENWSGMVVGNVVGEPARLDDSRLGADIIIGSKEVIDKVESGSVELSIAATMQLERAETEDLGYDYRSVGALDTNHVAVVKRGRAGPDVKIFDRGGLDMNSDDLSKMVAAAVKDAMPNSDGGKPTVDSTAIVKTLTAGMTPIIDKMEKIAADALKREQEAAAAEAKKKAEDSAKEFETEIVKRERLRASVLADAMPMIAEDKRGDVDKLDSKALMLLAIGDAATVPDGASEDYVKGIFDSLKRQRAAGALNGNVSAGAPGGGTEVEKAYKAHVANLTDAWRIGESTKPNGAGNGAGAESS